MGDQGGELASLERVKLFLFLQTFFSDPHLVETWTQESGDLLDQSVRGKEGVIALGQLLHLLLVLVQLLQVVRGHGGHPDGFGLVNMLLISEDADAELLTRNMLQPANIEFIDKN